MTARAEVTEVVPGIWRTSNEVSSGPYRLSNNAYLVVDDGEAALIDTAWWLDGGSAHLESLFEAAGTAPAAVRTIVLTHAHRDHSGFANLLEEWTDARLLVHESERGAVAALRDFQGLPDLPSAIAWYQRFGVPRELAERIVLTKEPDRPFDASRAQWIGSGHVLRVGSREFDVVHAPGHTPGHVCLIEHASGVLFSGDALLPRGHGNPHVTVRPFTPPDPLSDYVGGLERLRALAPDLTVCLPGHGPVVDDVPAIIDGHLGLVESKLEAAATAATGEPASVYELIARMPWRGGSARFDEMTGDGLFLSFADGLARLRRLASQGRIEAVDSVDGVERYRLAVADEGVAA